MKINANIDNGINVLREKMLDFCDSMPSPLVKTDDKMKYVYLEEFEKASPEFQDGFKGFVEKYDYRVRFIISMNDISKVIGPLLSRFNKICFTPINDDEKNFLLNGYYKYLMSVVKHSKMTVDDNIIRKIIDTNFPDLRLSIQDLQTIYITEDQNISIKGNYKDIFDFILNKNNNFSENFYFVMDNWVNQPKTLIDILGRPFYQYLINNHKEIIDEKGFKLLELNKIYNAEFETTTDPPLHVFSLICELKNILK